MWDGRTRHSSKHGLTAQERFWAKVNKNGPIIIPRLGKCWVWTGATDKDGYGRFGLDKDHRSEPAYRVAFEWENGPLAPGMEPDHLCSMEECVRPTHMKAVTGTRNNSNAHRKLTPVQVRAIEQAINAAPHKRKTEVRKALAREYGVASGTIYNVLKEDYK